MKFKENRAIYLQIAHHFLENILTKKWAEGDKIPSIREIAIAYEVNPNTTMRTFTYLSDKEIIVNKRGIGYYVADDGFQKSLALKKEEFVSEELPAFFKAMQVLGITLEDLLNYHTIYTTQPKKS
jgi:GntR family transcriptional regulator